MKKFILTISLLIIVITYILSYNLNNKKFNNSICKMNKPNNYMIKFNPVINNFNPIKNEINPIRNEINLIKNEVNPITHNFSLKNELEFNLKNKIKTLINISFNLIDNYDLFNKNIKYRISFGSCNYQLNDQSFWEKIIHFNPNLWIFLGDNIYADKYIDKIDNLHKTLDKPSIDNMIKQYEILVSNISFRKFMFDQNIKKIGIWDDHDYLKNNADVLENQNYKIMSKKLFTTFLNIPENNQMMNREGIYTYYDLVDGTTHIIRFFLLDVRTFRTDVDILGTDQWRWLENNLKKSTALVNILCSGSNILTKISDFSSWYKNGWAYNRLIKLLELYNIKNIIILSGDLHQGRLISKNNMIEIVSSTLSSQIEMYDSETEFNIGNVIKVHNFGFIDINYEYNKYYLIGGLIDFKGNLHNLIKINI